jgi:chromosome segregation ATPase
MAKKESEISVEERLKTLYQLQTTLSSIDEKRALRGELPLEVQDLEDEIAGLKTRVEHIEGDIVSFQQAVAQKQGEIAEAEESVERYKKQLDEVRNNREYDTLTKEIEFQSLEIELCNKKIREANVKVEDKKRELAPKVFIPRIRISTSPSAPGCAEKELTVTPLIRPCSKLEVLDTGMSLISLTFTEDTAPVRLAFFCVP